MASNAESERGLLESVVQGRHIRATAQELRAQVLRQKLSLGFTYCKLAETAIRLKKPDLALALIQRTRDIGAHAQGHVKQPGHVPNNAVSELHEILNELGRWVQLIAAELKQLDSWR